MRKILWVGSPLDLRLVASVGAGRIRSVGIVETVGNGFAKKSDSKVAGIAGQDVICRWIDARKKAFGGLVDKPAGQITEGVGGGDIVTVEIVVGDHKAVDVCPSAGRDVVAHQADVRVVRPATGLVAESEEIGRARLGIRNGEGTVIDPVTGVKIRQALICENRGEVIVAAVWGIRPKSHASYVGTHEASSGSGFAGGVRSAVRVGPGFRHLILQTDHHEENDGEDGGGGHEFDEGEGGPASLSLGKPC